EHFQRARFERRERAFELETHRLELRRARTWRNVDRLADGERHAAEGQRHLRPVPAGNRPVASRLDVEWKERVARGTCQPDGPRLRATGGPTRAVECEAGRLAVLHGALELEQRPLRSPGT